MIEITKIVEWDMGHRVPKHKSKCRHPHGHRYRAEVTVTGPLIEASGSSSEGMVMDFSDIKSVITTHVHDVLDHGFMVYEGDAIMTRLLIEEANGKEACDFNIIKVSFVPTAENIVQWCYEQIKNELPEGVVVSKIRLFETPNSWADYRPGSKC